MAFFWLMLYFLLALDFSNCYKFLFVPMPEGKSHQGSMHSLAKKLQDKGHEVVISSEVITEQNAGPVQQQFIKLRHLDEHLKSSGNPGKDEKLNQIIWEWEMNALTLYIPWNMTSGLCSSLLTKQLTEFWSIANQQWDMVFVDTMFAPCGIAISSLLNCPYALFHTSFQEIYNAEFQGLSVWPHLTAPIFATPSYTFDTAYFTHRLGGVFEYIQFHVILYPIQYLIQNTISPVVEDFSFSEYGRRSQGSFIEYPHMLDWPVPIGHMGHYVGYNCKTAEPNALPNELENFVSDPKSKGTILVAFGTMGNWKAAPKLIFDKFYNGLIQLDGYRIIWQYTGNTTNFPEHIKAMKWLPQQDLLLHPKTKMFISHGGLKSFKETVCAGVPVLYLPLFGEQNRNSMLAEVNHFGERLYKMTFTTEELVTKSRKILMNSSYSDSLRRIRKRWMDHVIPPLDQGAFWAEYIVRKKGMPEIYRIQSTRLMWFQHWCLDILFSVTMCVSIIIFVIKGLRIIVRF